MNGLVDLLLPRLGETMDEGRISAWLKQPGQSFRRGEIILEVETDKTVVEVPALTDGALVEILEPVDTLVPVDTAIARIRVTGAAPAPRNPKPDPTKPEQADPGRPPGMAHRPAAGNREGGGIPASPKARRLARRAGLAVEDLAGTGRRGRVTGDDVARVVQDDRARERPGDSPPAMAMRHWTPKPADARQSVNPVLLVHGLFADAGIFEPLARRLVRHGVSVAAVDLPAHGESAAGKGGLEEAIALLADLLQRHAEPVHLVGHSLGAAIAVAASHRAPASLSALTLLAPVGFGTPLDGAFPTAMLSARNDRDLQNALKLLASPMPPAPIRAALLQRIADNRPALQRLVEEVQAGVGAVRDIRQQAVALGVPVSAMFARADAVVPPGPFIDAPVDIALHVVGDGGHNLHVTHTDAVARVVLRNTR